MSKEGQLLRLLANRIDAGIVDRKVGEAALAAVDIDGGTYKNGMLERKGQLHSFTVSKVKAFSLRPAPAPAPAPESKKTAPESKKTAPGIGKPAVKSTVDKFSVKSQLIEKPKTTGL